MKKIFLLAFAVLAFAACSNDDEMSGPDTDHGTEPGPGPEPEEPFAGQVISFEVAEQLMNVSTGSDVVLGDLTMMMLSGSNHTFKQVFCAKEYAVDADYDEYLFGTKDQNTWFGSYYASMYDAWGGFALSANADRTAASADPKQQFAVWADGGANSTKNFAVCYDMNTPSEAYPQYMADYGYPTIEFAKPCIVDHLYIGNSTYVYNFFEGKASDSFKVKIIGSLNGVETGSETVTLVDGKSKAEGWQKITLTKLGSLDKVVFKVICDITKDPAYFCVDEIGILSPDQQ